MRAFNVVRFRVKPGFEASFVEHHRNLMHGFQGFLGGSLFKTGEGRYCITGTWKSYDDLVANRPKMIASLDQVRHMLEDLGGGLGVTDPISGEEVAVLAPTPGLEPAPPRAAAPARKKARARKKAKAPARKKAARRVARKKAKPARKKAKASARKKAKTPARKKAKRKATRRRR